jgi:hypothetical protein
MDPCIKLAREFKRADRAVAYAPPKDSAYQGRHEAIAERAESRLAVTKPTTPQGAARLLDHAARLSSTVFGEDIPKALRQIGREWRNSRRQEDDLTVLRQIVKLVELFPCDTMLSEDAQDDMLSMLNNALGFMCRPRLV